MKTKKLPEFFKPIFWYCDYSELSTDIKTSVEAIIIQTINYGDLRHWKWIFKYYGAKKVKKIIENIPASAFRPGALKLATLVLRINKLKYAYRIDRIRAEKNLRKS
ncbi:MAG: hypothetical protein Q8N69_02235 [bacterium]|nr:hypothetical protein [bacterium]